MAVSETCERECTLFSTFPIFTIYFEGSPGWDLRVEREKMLDDHPLSQDDLRQVLEFTALGISVGIIGKFTDIYSSHQGFRIYVTKKR